MRRVEHAMIQPAMAARHDLAISMPSTSASTSAAAPLLTGALLRASVVVSLVSILSGLLLLMRPAVSLVGGVAGQARLDTRAIHATREGQGER